MFLGKLYPYQTADVEVMKDRQKVLVGYGQGAGKTIMTIAAIEDLMDEGTIVKPGLVICLAGLKYQWEQAIRRWTGGTLAEHPRTGLPYYVGGTSEPLVIDGTAKQRAEQYAIAKDWKNSGVDYVILSYEQVVNDWNTVRRLPRGFVVCDEVSFIKGFRAQRSKRVKRLNADVKYGLTGTPIENGKLEEFFSIMEWVDPKVLGRWDIFDKAFIVRSSFGSVQRYRNIPVFRDRMKGALVRRTRKDPEVAPFFPEVDNDKPPIVVPLDREGVKAYRLIAKELQEDLRMAQEMFGSTWSVEKVYGMGGGDEADVMRGRIAQKMMALQMLCDHPELIRVSAQKFEDVMAGRRTDGGSTYCADLVQRGVLDKVTRTPKMDAAVHWIKERLETDERNKIVVFCTYVDTLHLFAARLARGEAVVYHGGMNAKQKDDAMSRFKYDPKVRVFLSSDAGGYGVDLPEANYLLNYSLPDKWGTADQRETRIVRASSEFAVVTIMRIFIEHAIEIRKHLLLEMKGKVASAFVDGKGYDSKGALAWNVDSLTKYLEASLHEFR